MDFTKFLIFTFISSFEYTAVLIFIFTLFRINYRWYRFQMIFVCVSLSYLSFTMRENDLAAITPFVQFFVFVIFMWLLFRIHLGYSALISFIGFFSYGLMQGVFILSIQVLSYIFESFSVNLYFVAIFTSSCFFLISYLLKRKNKGFTFVPNTDESHISNMRKSDITYLFIISGLLLLGIAMVYYSYYFTVEYGSIISFIIATVVLLVQTTLLLLYAKRKEKDEVGEDHD